MNAGPLEHRDGDAIISGHFNPANYCFVQKGISQTRYLKVIFGIFDTGGDINRQHQFQIDDICAPRLRDSHQSQKS